MINSFLVNVSNVGRFDDNENIEFDVGPEKNHFGCYPLALVQSYLSLGFKAINQ